MLEKVKDYFQFNKRERNGILLLSFLLLLLALVFQYSYLFLEETKTDFSKFEKELSDLQYEKIEIKEEKIDTVFYFNPNTLNDKGWLLLGLSEKQLVILRNYQAKGGEFKYKEDLKKCFAIKTDFYDRVEKYIDISKYIKPEINEVVLEVKKSIVELNAADSMLLTSIKGIGSFYAKQILRYRKELGGFVSYSQFKEIWGLEKLDMSLFKDQTRIDTSLIRKININTVDIVGLRNHPYFGYKEAKVLVNYRKQHGNYRQVKDIRNIKVISPKLFRKIAPYLKTHD